MIDANFRVCLDACVLASHSVCDLLLQLAEERMLYTPVFSKAILKEAHRTHVDKLGWPKELADSFGKEIIRAFPESMVDGWELVIPLLTNEEKDRHVLAAAIKGEAQLILTFNLKHFKKESLVPWDIRASHPQDYLITLYEMRPELVVAKLYDIANKRGDTPAQRLNVLNKVVPRFAEIVAEDQGWLLI
jgi:predicted nucleic acid-binding protein